MALLSSDRVVRCDQLYIQDLRYVKGDVLPLSVYTIHKHRLNEIWVDGNGEVSLTMDGVRIRVINKNYTPGNYTVPRCYSSSIVTGVLLVAGVYVVARYLVLPRLNSHT